MITFWAFLVLCSTSLDTYLSDNRVSVTLVPKWKNTPLLSEASEYVARESNSAFWRFLDLISKDLDFIRTNLIPPVDDYLLLSKNRLLEKRVKELAIQAISATSLNNSSLEIRNRLFTLSVSSRMFSPTVEMSHQLALTDASYLLNCSRETVLAELKRRTSGVAWVLAGSDAVFSIDKLKESIEKVVDPNSQPTLFPLEKVYSSPKDTSNNIPTVILYGDLSHHEFYSWHRSLKALSDDGLCNYAFRHYFQNRDLSGTSLNGYGVELALKSTEYKAMDDTKSEESDNVSLKETDKIVDVPIVAGFNFTQLRNIHPELTKELNEFHSHLLTTDDELRPLKAWQFRDLSLQACQIVMDGFLSNMKHEGFIGSYINLGLWSLRDISQNLPARASRLVNVNVNSSLRTESSKNQHVLTGTYGIQPGQSLLLLNGILLSPSVDIFALLDVIRQESKMMTQLHDLGIPGSNISQLIIEYGSSSGSVTNKNDPNLPGSRHSISNQFVLDLSNAPISYMNNLETDPAYAYWPSSLHTLFNFDFSGGLRRIRKNLYNVILIIDPVSFESREMLKLTESFLLHMTPVRFGIIWAVNPKLNSTSLILTRIFSYISSTIMNSHESPFPVQINGLGSPGPMAALSFLTEIYANAEKSNSELSIDLIKRKFEKLFPTADSDDIFTPESGNSDYDKEVTSHHEFLIRSGLQSIKKIPLILFNGIILDNDGIKKIGGFEDTVVTLSMEELMHVQSAVFQGQLSNSQAIFDLYQKTATIVPRFNVRLLNKKKDNSNQGSLNSPKYINFNGYSIPMGIFTMWIVIGDLDQIFDSNLPEEHRLQLQMDCNLALNALTFLRSAHSTKGLRIGFVYNPLKIIKEEKKSTDHWLTRVLYLVGNPINITLPLSNQLNNEIIAKRKYAEQMSGRNFAIRLIKEILESIKTSKPMKSLEELLVSGMDSKQIHDAIQLFDRNSFMQMHSTIACQIIGLKPGERAVVVNGKIVGPFEPFEEFLSDDFRLAERLALDNGAKELGDKLEKILGTTAGAPDIISELTWQLSSVLQSDGISDKSQNGHRILLHGVSYNHSGFIIHGNKNEPNFELVAIIDPASRDAQRLSHILIVLQHSLPCTVKVLFNPSPSLSELPVKSFYRFVWEPSLFPENESILNPSVIVPRAYFTHLPGQSLLTLGMDEPHGWMVAAIKAVQDLDNLRLVDYHSTQHLVEAVFELEYLLLEGHCMEEGSMKPPRGLQFTLGPTPTTTEYDTIVMANLGYFQLKANPGAWHLNIRAGKSQKLYEISGQEHTDTSVNSKEIITLISNFRSKIIEVSVNKRAEFASESMLDDSSEESNNCLKHSIASHLPWHKCASNQETINIFSVASGHLYERLLRIMMLTVIRHTNSPVKFWFLKNYLSPTFKDFIPYMATEYGFEYEFVQYKWPRWLHAQTEKQRIIWGYKILFLDVLFPLNVTKIIFVDADQIVRADLKELADLDLDGAPYGYTPFCDSRKEMDGFRFWKQGYWANHLAGRPYHISALYVVDLTRFRRLAAGDRLRGQYHGLSQDPNSLSNLDQDLPNNMIHQVPIKSLPQEWLWCETWCSDESLAKAKTIDLCNNPRTKEPKLTAAMRIAPEWVDYDREIKKLWKRVYVSPESSSSSSSAASASEFSTVSTTAEPTHLKESPVEGSKIDDDTVKTEL
ncbi:putative udp-glucose glycoprotein:glucosyltransferase [Schistosoma mansoni]|uniref:putative udp-glucose glycoprotein:glucosyltransferase n=1 Tax=Schistosoma mansoni TaxID=6183 RepID=UPI00022DC277|nr:putative udp-glucose glycoprotein:glucosyltransferase [Schistosoma mansoni]|eukprot:XP_018649005.1 putative udp-glucose glycoprotein:glucosyltransferase [Schistosoma mansoni]